VTSLEISARTVEEALEEGLKKLGVKRGNVKLEILNGPSQGIFKFLSAKAAKVRITVIKEPAEYMKEFVERIVNIIGLEGEVTIEESPEGDIFLKISGKGMGLLIGKRGNTLNALQYLANVVFHRQFAACSGRVVLDIENYRQKRKKTLEQLAKNLALKALRTKKEVTLEPMTPQERRIIHMALKNYRDVVTSSHGEEPYRKVIITPR